MLEISLKNLIMRMEILLNFLSHIFKNPLLRLLEPMVVKCQSLTIPVEEPKDPDTCNVYQLLHLFLTAEEDVELRAKYQAWGLSYKYAKEYLYEKMSAMLEPIQQRFAQISDDEITALLEKHSAQAWAIAQAKLDEVYKKIAFVR